MSHFIIALTPAVYDVHPYPDMGMLEAETMSDAVVAFCESREGNMRVEFRAFPGPGDVFYVEVNCGDGWSPFGYATVVSDQELFSDV